MTDKSFSGPMTMIKIDGLKIKRLREQQGLTQLYLATAVDVTTDTISRWENKRYPSIKKENGIRLAEALGVELDEILDKTLEENDSPKTIETIGTILNEKTGDIEKKSPGTRKIWPILLLSTTLLGVISAFLFSYFNATKDINITGMRYAPQHYVDGQPFPVIIELAGQTDVEIAFILKESLPPGATILSTAPKHNGKNSGEESLKWITRSQLPATFTYLIAVQSDLKEKIMLQGTISLPESEDIPISGTNMMSAGQHHWADSNKDNVISDKEILTIYDKYSNFDGLEGEIDLIEEIWLGEGYNWDSSNRKFTIID